MVRTARGVDYETALRPVVAIGNDYAPNHLVRAHRHPLRSQVLYVASGLAAVTTGDGAWVVPRERSLWIPLGVEHEIRGVGRYSTHSLFIEPSAVADMPGHCQVLGATPLMQALLQEAVDLPLEYDPDGRDALIMALLLAELRRLPALPLSLPFPRQAPLAARCRAFLAAPTARVEIDDWSQAMGMSRSAFTRLFRRETGLSFAAWRQQACALAALPRLSAGEPVTGVALDLGYESPAAFTTMFKRVLGEPPSRYFAASQAL